MKRKHRSTQIREQRKAAREQKRVCLKPTKPQQRWRVLPAKAANRGKLEPRYSPFFEVS